LAGQPDDAVGRAEISADHFFHAAKLLILPTVSGNHRGAEDGFENERAPMP
jgi:hypothetical protein